MGGLFGRLTHRGVDPGDRAVIQHMLKSGEKLSTRPRETTHYLLFEDETSARHAGTGVAGAGFRAEVTPPGDGLPHWRVEAFHTIIVDENSITAARKALTAVAHQAGGAYDGWDTYADAALDRDLAR